MISIFFSLLIIGLSVGAEDLPPLFDIEDYYSCESQQGVYCKVDINLQANNEASGLAQEIKISLADKHKFNRSTLHRMICIAKETYQNRTVEEYITDLSKRKLERFNVSLTVANLECNEDLPFQFYDVFTIIFCVSYLMMVYQSTVYDVRRDDPKTPVSKYDKWFKIFSMRHNWRAIVRTNTNSDYVNLKSLQGLRSINAILIITAHTKICHLFLFIENPRDYEESFSRPLNLISYQLDYFIVQDFFMTSSLIQTNQILDLYKKTGTFSLKNCLILYINRVIRLLPTCAIMVPLVLFGIKLYPKGTPVVDIINMTWESCTNRWFGTMFQLTSFCNTGTLCNIGTWYLSVDTLFYVSTLLLLYLHLNYKISLQRLLMVIFLVLCFIYGVDIYRNDLDVIFKPTPDSVRTMIVSPTFYYLHINPFASRSTNIVGIMMGYVYFNTKQMNIKLSKVQNTLWIFLFLGLPTLSISMCFLDVKGIYRAFLGPILKPMFALGLGLGVLGMSKGYGGPIKRILEWDMAIKMSNFTYCTYLYHLFLIFLMHGSTRGLYRYSIFYMVLSYVQDVLVSFGGGILMTLLIEYPGLRLQKMFVPQIKNPAHKM